MVRVWLYITLLPRPPRRTLTVDARVAIVGLGLGYGLEMIASFPLATAFTLLSDSLTSSIEAILLLVLNSSDTDWVMLSYSPVSALTLSGSEHNRKREIISISRIQKM